ncbi:hypothetical protein EB1_35460 [Empedobacter brevis NBRC 14943 = ATCC 43319]|uniref:Uncharacterized protein n=1 Tax=Empedobacter brevis NBRC 14943 = ATCC 43319 TaxID=1218108 RepID=A0A511NLY1_9FLAO|nr:hypothetical protein [Empedobacter brevis]GEM53756.1 hypothetical protein EB1_35460 [Empedobacter brevis NBRC 14943 = ATCC 43319]
MTSGRINEELDNLIYYIDEYQKAKIELDKAINKTQIEDANYIVEINLLAIENVFLLNHELKDIVLPKETSKKEYINDSFLTTDFITDVKSYIRKVENYA